MIYLLWLIFAALAVVIYFAGSRLTYFGDVLGEKWEVHRSFIGLILLSTVTSLPELGTSLSAVLIPEAPNLAMGNVLGSNLFNVAILPVLAVLYRENFLHRASQKHSSTGHLIVLLYCFAGAGLLQNYLKIFSWPIQFKYISPWSIVIFGFYLIGLYYIFLSRDSEEGEKSLSETEMYGQQSHTKTLVKFAFYGILVILAGGGLSTVGDKLALMTGLGDTFFGSLFLAFITSLPEIVVCWAALHQLEAVNLALGNIFGSCLFNLAIIPAFDLFYPAAPIFSVLGPQHLLTIFSGILMVSLAGYALLIRRESPARVFPAPELVVLAVIYLASLYLLLILR